MRITILAVSRRLVGLVLVGMGVMLIRAADDVARSIVVNRRLPGFSQRVLRTMLIIQASIVTLGEFKLVIWPD